MTRGKFGSDPSKRFMSKYDIERWLVLHGVDRAKAETATQIIFKVGAPNAVAVWPWNEDTGAMTMKVKLDEREVVRLDPEVSVDRVWIEGITVPCDRCRVPIGVWCMNKDGLPVSKANFPHSIRIDRARGVSYGKWAKLFITGKMIPGPIGPVKLDA